MTVSTTKQAVTLIIAVFSIKQANVVLMGVFNTK